MTSIIVSSFTHFQKTTSCSSSTSFSRFFVSKLYTWNTLRAAKSIKKIKIAIQSSKVTLAGFVLILASNYFEVSRANPGYSQGCLMFVGVLNTQSAHICNMSCEANIVIEQCYHLFTLSRWMQFAVNRSLRSSALCGVRYIYKG